MVGIGTNGVGNGKRNIKLDQAEFIDMGLLSNGFALLSLEKLYRAPTVCLVG